MARLGGEGHADASITSCGFNDRGVGSEQATPFSILKHVFTQAVFDTAAGIKHFQFGKNMNLIWRLNRQFE